MKKIKDLNIFESAYVDLNAICRDKDSRVRVSLLYEALPLNPVPRGFRVAYIERVQRKNKSVLKLFHPRVKNFSEIPEANWETISFLQAAPVSIVSFLDPNLVNVFYENLPLRPCRLCLLNDAEKHDLCFQCNKIVRFYIGKAKKEFPGATVPTLRKSILRKLRKINAFDKS